MKWPGVTWNARERRDREIADELRTHVAMAVADRIGRGETAAQAEANARREFGNLAVVGEATREAAGGLWLERLTQDIRFGVRMLRRTPGFSIVAVLCLALGIGANAAVYGWMEGIVLRPFPGVADQERIVAVAGTAKGTTGFSDVSWPDFIDLEKGSTSFEDLIVSKIVGTSLTSGDRAERAVGLMVSANYFDALGVRPILGRGFASDEGTGKNGHPVTVISYREWKERFRGDPAIIGKTQTYNSVPHVIVGVAPPGFLGTFVGYSMQFWVPTSMQAAFDPGGYKLDDRGARWIEGFARLKRGVTLGEAQAEVSAAAKRLEADYPDVDRGRGVQLLPLSQLPFDNAKNLLPTLRIGFAVVVFVLLVACANVANLLLVRSFARRHEMTLRLSLGAGRSRLIRQLVTEGMILAMLATAGGLLVAYWCRNALVLFFPSQGGVTYTFNGDFDWRVVAMSAGVGLASTLLFAVIPAFQASNIDLAGALKSDSRSSPGGRGRSRLRSVLVSVQVSLSFVLLVGAGLVLESLQSIRKASPGFSTQNVVTTAVNLFGAGYDTVRAKAFDEQLLTRVRALGGIDAAAMARSTPFSTRPYDAGPIAADGFDAKPDEQPTASYNSVTPGYFATMGIGLTSGRDFTVADDESSEPVAIVGESMAAQLWRGQSPMGRRLQINGRWRQVRKGHQVRLAARVAAAAVLCPTTPELFDASEHLHPNGDGAGLTDSGAGSRDPRSRREYGAVRGHQNARASRSIDCLATRRGHASQPFRVARGRARGNRVVRRHGVRRVPEPPRIWIAHGTRRRADAVVPTRDLERSRLDDGRHRARRGGRARVDASTRVHAIQGQSARSGRVCVGARRHARRRGGGLSITGVARRAH
jgi:predicted permease